MIDPVKLADFMEEIAASYEQSSKMHSNPQLAAKWNRTATALRLLAEYAEAAGAEVEAWRAHAYQFVPSLIHADGGKNPLLGIDRTDAARAALEAAGIRVGGGE